MTYCMKIILGIPEPYNFLLVLKIQFDFKIALVVLSLTIISSLRLSDCRFHVKTHSGVTYLRKYHKRLSEDRRTLFMGS